MRELAFASTRIVAVRAVVSVTAHLLDGVIHTLAGAGDHIAARRPGRRRAPTGRFAADSVCGGDDVYGGTDDAHDGDGGYGVVDDEDDDVPLEAALVHRGDEQELALAIPRGGALRRLDELLGGRGRAVWPRRRQRWWRRRQRCV